MSNKYNLHFIKHLNNYDMYSSISFNDIYADHEYFFYEYLSIHL